MRTSENTQNANFAVTEFSEVQMQEPSWPRSSTYECPRLISASLGYYHDLLIIPIGESCPFVGFLAYKTGAKS
jgi:hypothetical protein